jgi:acid phosphatase
VKQGWDASDKTPRRLYLASRYRILLLFGDKLVDFIGYRASDSDAYEDIYRVFKQDRTARRAELDKHKARWGESWILLPNPIYGSWERNLYDFRDSSSAEEKIDMKLDRLDTWK